MCIMEFSVDKLRDMNSGKSKKRLRMEQKIKYNFMKVWNKTNDLEVTINLKLFLENHRNDQIRIMYECLDIQYQGQNESEWVRMSKNESVWVSMSQYESSSTRSGHGKSIKRGDMLKM